MLSSLILTTLMTVSSPMEVTPIINATEQYIAQDERADKGKRGIRIDKGKRGIRIDNVGILSL